MPWRIPSGVPEFRDSPASCPECQGSPLDLTQCSTCGAILIARDPRPGEFLTTTFVPLGLDGRKLPRRQRRTLRIQDGWKRQADGTMAKVYRVIDKMSDRYIEEVKRDGRLVHQVDEPLTKHRGHGSAKRSKPG